MAVRDDVLARRWLVGVELTNARVSTSLKQTDVAKAFGVSQGLVSQWESGKYFPERDQVLAMMQLYGRSLDEAERLATFASQPSGRTWLAPWEKVVAEFTRKYLGAEGFASRVFQYAQAVIPAHLQTPAYAAAITAPSARVQADHEQRLVELRMFRRRRVLDGDLHLTAVIEENVLDRPVGADRSVMKEQYEQLKLMAAMPNVDLRIIPTAVGRHDGLEGRFIILYFDAADGARLVGPVAYMEIPGDAVYKTHQDQVAAYTGSAGLITSLAMTQIESVKAIDMRLAACP